MDVFEQLILVMIIRREVINFAIKTKHYELLGANDEFRDSQIDQIIQSNNLFNQEDYIDHQRDNQPLEGEGKDQRMDVIPVKINMQDNLELDPESQK